MDADGQPVTEGLPYSLEIATADMDMWAIGVLLFLFITGENLFPVNRDDDLVSVDGMRAVSGACIMHFYARAIATTATAAAACIATTAVTRSHQTTTHCPSTPPPHVAPLQSGTMRTPKPSSHASMIRRHETSSGSC